MTRTPKEDDDLRVKRTRKLLQEAFIALTVEKGYAAVTVSDIAERAMVNRAAFYRHYLDKFDLLEQYVQDLGKLTAVGKMNEEESFIAEKLTAQPEDVPSGLVTLLKHIQQHGDFYRVMLGANGDAKFIQRFRELTEWRYRVLLNRFQVEDHHLPPLELRLNYASCAGIGAILWWLENDQPLTVEELARWMAERTRNIMGLPVPSR
jgi:AcrR family transcriptional regulator